MCERNFCCTWFRVFHWDKETFPLDYTGDSDKRNFLLRDELAPGSFLNPPFMMDLIEDIIIHATYLSNEQAAVYPCIIPANPSFHDKTFMNLLNELNTPFIYYLNPVAFLRGT